MISQAAVCLKPFIHTLTDHGLLYFFGYAPIQIGGRDFNPLVNKAAGHFLFGGEYKIRERIQRNIADLRLLAIPASWSRVADSNLNWGAF